MSRRLALRSVRAVFVAVVVVLAWTLPGAVASAAPMETAWSSYSYDAATDSSAVTLVESPDGVAVDRPSQASSPPSTADLVSARPVFVAAETAGGALDASELSAGQASNYARYAKKLPSGAQDPVITRGANGSVQFSADVPGRVPGSYATYTKVVDSSGTTTDYYKTTVAPDGSIVHVKIKFP